MTTEIEERFLDKAWAVVNLHVVGGEFMRSHCVVKDVAREFERLTSENEALHRLLGEIHKEAATANDAIRLNRDGSGSGRVKVATAMNRIAALSKKGERE